MIEMLQDKQYERGLGRKDIAILSSYPLYNSAETKIIFFSADAAGTDGYKEGKYNYWNV